MPEAVTHLTARELAAFREGRLPAAAAAADHLAACPACRQAAESPPADLPPELVGHAKFRIVRELGRGGMGVIYLAEHRVMDKPVALKVISPAVLDNPTAVARFLGEVRAAAKLDHQNVARAYDADRAGDLHFLVMEFVEGITLAQLMEQRGPLPVALACHYVCQAALGLQHAFEQGMVHRDVKPQNLMVTPRGQVKLLDFGLARLRGEQQASTRLTRLESFMGTPEYVAPEQATDARQADTRSDVYSLGCTLYALLTGRPPFVGATAVQIVLAHVESKPAPLRELRPDVPAGLSAVAAKMLAKDPARRYRQPIDVAEALAPFVRTASQPGAGAAVPPGVVWPPSGTAVGGDTRPEKRAGRGRSNPPGGGSAAWWRSPPVLAGAACAAVALVVLAGLIVVLKRMAVGDAAVAGASPTQQEDEPSPAGPRDDDAADAVPQPAEKHDDGDEKAARRKKSAKAAAEEVRRREQAKKLADETRRRDQAAKKAQDAERARQRERLAKEAEDAARRQQAAKEAADARKREEARHKAETEAAAKLKLAKRLLDDERNARDAGNKEEAHRLHDQYPEALRDIVKKYPDTQAAKQAKKLLDK